MTSPVLWSLIAIQLALGLFDILYHHEMTERLAWRSPQRRELKLHGARNLTYAVLFLVLGLTEPRGVWAMLIIALLAAEVVITLTDFVEEDLSRKLPASERVTHTLLAVPSSFASFPSCSIGQACRRRSFRSGTGWAACSSRWRCWV
jgi:uncharacterized protein